MLRGAVFVLICAGVAAVAALAGASGGKSQAVVTEWHHVSTHTVEKLVKREERAIAVKCGRIGAPVGVQRWRCNVQLSNRSGTLVLKIARDGAITTTAIGVPGFVIA